MKKLTKKYLILLLKKKTAGIKKNVMNKRFKEKSPIVDNICKLSIDHEKLYAQRFQGNPVRISLLIKSESEKAKLIKKIDDIFFSQKFPINNIGNEKNKDKNKGINIKLNGIKNLNDSSKVNELAIQ
jgi:hypothetical protein